MGYEFDQRFGYRMPTHFGPAPGPRQRPAGGTYGLDEQQRAVSVWASFAAEHDQVAALLPPGFEPSAQADLTVEIKNMTNIGWLAGRGYSVATVSTGVVWTGGTAPAPGRFKLVLWENAADPIITGREELGYPKLYAEIPDILFAGDTAAASVSWGGFEFLALGLSGLRPSESAAPPGGDSFHLHYMPRVGCVGAHGLVQVILTPRGQGALRVAEREAGEGTARFSRAAWRELPTLVNVVNGLAGLEFGACLGAGCLRTAGTTDLRIQEIVAEGSWTGFPAAEGTTREENP